MDRDRKDRTESQNRVDRPEGETLREVVGTLRSLLVDNGQRASPEHGQQHYKRYPPLMIIGSGHAHVPLITQGDHSGVVLRKLPPVDGCRP